MFGYDVVGGDAGHFGVCGDGNGKPCRSVFHFLLGSGPFSLISFSLSVTPVSLTENAYFFFWQAHRSKDNSLRSRLANEFSVSFMILSDVMKEQIVMRFHGILSDVIWNSSRL